MQRHFISQILLIDCLPNRTTSRIFSLFNHDRESSHLLPDCQGGDGFTLFEVSDTYLPSWIEPEAERRRIRVDHTLACLEIAAFIGCRNISVPPGGPLPENMTRKEALQLFHQGMDQVIPKAEKLGV